MLRNINFSVTAEDSANLYLAVQNENGTITQHKYHRSTCNESESQYIEIIIGNYNEIFKIIKLKLFIENFDNEYVGKKLCNQSPEHLTKQANITMANFLKDNPGKIFYLHEEHIYGDIDSDGPIEYFWTLYLFFRHNDGSVSHHKFFREFSWTHNYHVKMDEIPYEETIVSRHDFANNLFVL